MLLNLFIPVCLFILEGVRSQERCGVFEPFRVSPERAKYQIGGAFPLHLDDCLTVRPSAVQQLVAVQWALSYWNQIPENEKIALYAGDSCSREMESLSQIYQFLQQSGHFTPSACTSKGSQVPPAGILAPSDMSSVSDRLTDALKAFGLPIVALSTGTAELLRLKGVGANLIAVAPPLSLYTEMIEGLMSSLEANLVSLLIEPSQERIAAAFASNLRQSGVVVKSVVLASDRDMTQKLTDSRMIISLLRREAVERAFLYQGVGSLSESQRLWIFAPLSGTETEDFNDATHDLLAAYTPRSVAIVLQQKRQKLPAFQSYFLDILKNNFQSYSLLTAYMKQMYNCSLQAEESLRCQDFSIDQLAQNFRLASGVEEVVKGTLILARYGRLLTGEPGNVRPSPLQLLRSVRPSVEVSPFEGFELQLDDKGNLLGTEIEGFQLVTGSSPSTGVGLRKVIKQKLGGDPVFFSGDLAWPGGEKFTSACSSWNPECSTCERLRAVGPPTSHLLKRGDIYVVGLFPCGDLIESNGQPCGDAPHSLDSIVMPLAFFFGLERGVSQSHNWKNLDIGAVFTNIRDGRGAGAVREVADWEDFCTQVQHIGSERTENVSVTPTQVLSYVSGLNYDATNSVSQLFGKSGIRKQLISSRPDPSVLWPNTQKSQTSAAVIAILKQLKIDFVSVYMSKKDNECLEAFDNFRNSAQLAHICIADEKFVGSENMTLTEPPATLVVLMFTNTLDTRVLLEAHRSQWPGKRNMYIFVGKSLEWDGDRLNDWNNQLLGSLAIQNESPSRPDFLEFLGSITPELLPQPWLMDFWQSHFNCSPNGYQSSRQLSPCTGRERLPVSKLGHLMNERNLITAVENFLSHIDHTYGLLCPKRTGFCEAFHRHYREHPFEISSLSEPLWVIRNFQLRHNTNSVLLEIGNWSESKGLLITDGYRWYDGETWSRSVPQSRCQSTWCRCAPAKDFWATSLEIDGATETDATLIDSVGPTRTRMKILLGLTCCLTLCGIGIFILVVYKITVGIVRGNQSLGLMLLGSCLLLYVSAFFFLFEPSRHVCQARWFSHSFSYALVFGVMIAKAVQLRNAETLGSNGYVSFWTYWLLLFFIAGVQGALNLQWVMTRNPLHSGLDNYNGAEFRPTSSCSWTRTEFLMSHVYDVLLLLLVCCLAAMNRNVKRLADRNWGETKWLLTTGLLCLPVWIGWMVAVALLPVGLLDTAVVIASLTSATLILSLMFGPKLFILISYHPVADPSGRVPSPDRLSSAASTTTKSSMASTLGSIRSKSPPQLVFAPNVSQPPKGNAADCRADDNFTSLSHA